MSSVTRNYAVDSRLPDPASYVMLSYTGEDGNDAPYPWRFNKQTQVIDLEFINGFNSGIDTNTQPFFVRGQTPRAAHNVLGLGSNFVAWMEDSAGADVGSVVMTENPILCSANVVSPNTNPNSSLSSSSTDLISFESSAGSLVSDYLKTMIFLKPLVVRYTVSGVTTYRYFTNNFEGNT